MGSAQGRMTTHQQKKFDTAALLEFRDRFALPLTDSQVENVEFLRPPPDSAEMKYLHGCRSKLGGYLPSRNATAAPLAPPAADAFGRFALRGGRQGDVDDDGLRADAVRAAEGPRPRPASRADHRRRGAHLRHGRPVPADRHLLAGRPALPAGGQHADQLLPGGGRRPDPRGRHQRGRRDRVVGGGGHQLLDERPADAAVLHLLFDVRLPARRRPAVGRGRFADARLPARRDGRPHHARRRRPAAPGRHQPPRGEHDPELPRLRPVLRLRTRVHRRGRHAPPAEGAGRRVLLRHGDERELSAAVGAGGRARRRAARHASRACRRRRQGAPARRRHHPARGHRGRRTARTRARHRGRRVLGHELHRAAARGDGDRARAPARHGRRQRVGRAAVARQRHADRRGERLRARGGGPDPAVRRGPLCRPGHRRVRPVGHAGGACARSSRSIATRSSAPRCTRSAVRRTHRRIPRRPGAVEAKRPACAGLRIPACCVTE